jgi:hypothetical protein
MRAGVERLIVCVGIVAENLLVGEIGLHEQANAPLADGLRIVARLIAAESRAAP